MPPELETQKSETPLVETPPTSLITETPPAETTGLETPKADEAPPAEPPAPLTAEDIVLPDGFEVSEELRDDFLKVMNDAEMSPQNRVKSLVDLQAKAVQAASDASTAAWTDMQTKWRDEVKADPAYSSDDKLQPTLGRIGKLITEYGSEELSAVFDLTGAGNNLHVVKFLDKLSQHLTEGGPVSGLPMASERSTASKMYPSMKG